VTPIEEASKQFSEAMGFVRGQTIGIRDEQAQVEAVKCITMMAKDIKAKRVMGQFELDSRKPVESLKVEPKTAEPKQTLIEEPKAPAEAPKSEESPKEGPTMAQPGQIPCSVCGGILVCSPMKVAGTKMLECRHCAKLRWPDGTPFKPNGAPGPTKNQPASPMEAHNFTVPAEEQGPSQTSLETA
jgi:hypothetical protein